MSYGQEYHWNKETILSNGVQQVLVVESLYSDDFSEIDTSIILIEYNFDIAGYLKMKRVFGENYYPNGINYHEKFFYNGSDELKQKINEFYLRCDFESDTINFNYYKDFIIEDQTDNMNFSIKSAKITKKNCYGQVKNSVELCDSNRGYVNYSEYLLFYSPDSSYIIEERRLPFYDIEWKQLIQNFNQNALLNFYQIFLKDAFIIDAKNIIFIKQFFDKNGNLIRKSKQEGVNGIEYNIYYLLNPNGLIEKSNEYIVNKETGGEQFSVSYTYFYKYW